MAQPEAEKAIQTRLIMAEDGDIIELPAGKTQLLGSLSMDGKNRITIRGAAGANPTVLSWKGQKTGAEGLKITNSTGVLLENFTVQDSKGDLIKAQECTRISFKNITAEWTGGPKPANGGYAIYPVQCRSVRIEKCTARGASDAGIYVGQSDDVLVTGCFATENVAGIEIENTTDAIVTDNLSTGNTGGILVFDLPGLIKKQGGNVQVFGNRIVGNNLKNFAPKGNIVGEVPAGTGVMILATGGVEIARNEIRDNKTASCAIVSYFITEIPIADSSYVPWPSAVFVHDNQFSRGRMRATLKHKIGLLLRLKFRRKVPHILWDGIQNPAWTGADGALLAERKICIRQNVGGSFANLRADKKFKNISRDLAPHDCERPVFLKKTK